MTFGTCTSILYKKCLISIWPHLTSASIRQRQIGESTVGKRNYFTRKVTYFTIFIGCWQISVNVAIDPFPSDFYLHFFPYYFLFRASRLIVSIDFSWLLEDRDSPWSNSAYPQWVSTLWWQLLRCSMCNKLFLSGQSDCSPRRDELVIAPQEGMKCELY